MDADSKAGGVEPGGVGAAASIVLLLLTGWACSGDGKEPLPPPSGGIAVVGGRVDGVGVIVLDFEETSVGGPRELALVLQNEGKGEVSLAVDAPAAPFLLAEAPATVRGGERAELRFRFAPTHPGSFEGKAEVRHAGGSIAIRLEGAARESAACALSASRTSLRFTVEADEPEFARTGRLRITNHGELPCTIRSPRIEGDPSFSLALSEAFDLMPGGSREVLVHFLPHKGAAAVLVIESDDAELRVELGTKAANDCLRAGKDEALHLVGAGCGPSAVDVENACDESLAIDLASSPGFLVGRERKPVTLLPMDKVNIGLEFAPTGAPWEREGAAVLQAENGDRIWWRLTGELEWREESFVAEPAETLDVLFVVDVAESLAEYDFVLEEVARTFAARMAYSLDLDLRVHVTTTSMDADGSCGAEAGRLVPLDGSRPGTVTWATPDREEVLRSNLRAPACQAGGGQGLAAVEAALGEDGWPAWRRGRLNVAIFSVEDDMSPLDVDHYLVLFDRELDGGHRYLDAIFLYVPTDSCREHLPASRYLALGSFASPWPICAGFDGGAFPMPFNAELAATPADLDGNGWLDGRDGIEVLLDGVSYTGRLEIHGGRLELGVNSHEQPVLRGSRVEIRYPLSCE